MLPELAEGEAHGEIAAIYSELRTLCGVPYVSSMQRHLATRPGWLEWAWRAVAPAFRSGLGQSAAWEAARDDTDFLPALPKLDHESLIALGVDAKSVEVIRNICLSFIRVSPINLMFSGLVRSFLDRANAPAPRWAGDIVPMPSTLPALPAMVAIGALGADQQRAVRDAFEISVAGQSFVPGLYRMLAHWPRYLEHLSKVLGPQTADPQTVRACEGLCKRIDDLVPSVAATLISPPLPPDPTAAAEVVSAIERYRVTSPQMVVYSRMIERSLIGL